MATTASVDNGPAATGAAASADCDDGVATSTKRHTLSVTERARVERNRLKARALRDARLAARPHTAGSATHGTADTGGGFLPEAEEERPPRIWAPPAPVADPSERPTCVDCGARFARSRLFEEFGYAACDDCAADEDARALVTRTEAKSEYLLKDCDLDLRPPPLRCVRRRNPHGARFGDMRLYLRAQVEARALEVWGDEPRLESERARRDEARARSRLAQTQRRLRALRMDVRSSLYDRTRGARHDHEFGEETHDEAEDVYTRVCVSCGHVETYEKM